MAKKTYIIRLYRVHDLDLITFIETHHFDLVKGVYSALTAFSKGETFIINIPPKREEKSGDLKRTYARLLTLDTEKDSKAVKLMEKIKNGYHNSFLKNILRLYLSYPISELFLDNEEDMDYFDQMFGIFRRARKTVNAGKEVGVTATKEKDVTKKETSVVSTIVENDEEGKLEKTELSSENELKKQIEESKTYDEVVEEAKNEIPEEEADEITDLFSSFL